MDVTARFGKNLSCRRHDAGMTQAELAARASMHRTEVSHLERGERCPFWIETLLKLAGVFWVDPASLLDGIVWVPEPGGDGRYVVPDPH